MIQLREKGRDLTKSKWYSPSAIIFLIRVKNKTKVYKIGVTGRKYSVDTLITFKLLVGDFGFGMKGRRTYSRIPSEA